jgi:Ser/Thr protein kinase RdoA (MazF antagonist)
VNTVVERVARAFGLEPVETEAVARGHINDTYAVSTRRGDYVVQRLNEAVFTDLDGMVANIATVHRHLRGALVPEPVPACDGNWIVRDEGAWRASRRVDGAPPTAPCTPAIARAAGELVGALHARTADLDPSALVVTMPGFHDPVKRLATLRAHIASDTYGRAASVADEIALARAAEPLAHMAADLVHRVPLHVAHNDAKLDNMLFRDQRAVCLVDLDTLMPGAWFWDVGDLLRSASSPAAEDEPDVARVVLDRACYDAALAGYVLRVAEHLTAGERDALQVAGAIVVYEQAVRFLTDWLAGDVYYRTTRPGQNRDRARAQFRLLQSMPHAVTLA